MDRFIILNRIATIGRTINIIVTTNKIIFIHITTTADIMTNRTINKYNCNYKYKRNCEQNCSYK